MPRTCLEMEGVEFFKVDEKAVMFCTGPIRRGASTCLCIAMKRSVAQRSFYQHYFLVHKTSVVISQELIYTVGLVNDITVFCTMGSIVSANPYRLGNDTKCSFPLVAHLDCIFSYRPIYLIITCILSAVIAYKLVFSAIIIQHFSKC